jgi:hypothetical protein
MREIGADRVPRGFAHALGQQGGNPCKGEAVNDSGVDALQLGFIEARRRAAEVGPG